MILFRSGMLLSLVVLLGFVLPSCGEPDVVAGGDEETELVIEFTGNNASDCAKSIDGSHDYTLTIAVDKVVDQTTGATEVHDFEAMQIDNTNNQKFELNIPETGGFVITVLLTTNECVSCCSVECADSPQTGRATLRDFRTFLGDPGVDIVMSLDLLFCNCC